MKKSNVRVRKGTQHIHHTHPSGFNGNVVANQSTENQQITKDMSICTVIFYVNWFRSIFAHMICFMLVHFVE